jgi:hypothetical protein
MPPVRLLVVALGGAAALLTACPAVVECGSGTVERDGQCVDADEEAGDTDNPRCEECGALGCNTFLFPDADGDGEPDCGCAPGFVEDASIPDGMMCVPIDDNGGDDDGGTSVTDGGNDHDDGATAGATAPTTYSSQSAGDGDGGDTAGDSGVPPYTDCPGGSDVECQTGQVCLEQYGACTQSCSRDTDCPDPVDGTGVQRCEHVARGYHCVIGCVAEGTTCPTGMQCEVVALPDGPLQMCVWP